MTAINDDRISYGTWRQGLRGFPGFLRELISEERPTSFCDVGGGAAPALSPTEAAQYGVSYTLLDISQSELDKSPDEFEKVCADATLPGLSAAVGRRFDMVQSHMLAEHISDPAAFHRNVFDLLNPGGVAVHLMPTMWDPAFVVNRLVPDRLTSWLVRKLQPGRRFATDQGKFPAYYRWCRGPSAKMMSRFEGLGYEVHTMNGYFGTGYALRVPPVNRVFERVTARLVRNPRPFFTSYCVLVLRRPAGSS